MAEAHVDKVAAAMDIHRYEGYVYAGFWVRVLASIIDTVLVMLVTSPLLYWVYGPTYVHQSMMGSYAGAGDFLITFVLPMVAVILFWMYRQATPGKMAFGARVVDARTGAALSFGQSLGRYLGYFVAIIPLGLGLLWVAFDARKQGWHDKLAGTVVIRPRGGGAPVRFDAPAG